MTTINVYLHKQPSSITHGWSHSDNMW